MFNRKTFAAALVAVGALWAGTAQAGHVNWSIGINLPPVGTVISNGPVYVQPQPYYAPEPVYVEPAPVVVYRPAPVVVYRPAPVVVERRYYGPPVVESAWVVPGREWHRDRREWREERRDRWHERHDEYGQPSRGDRWDGEPRRQHH